MVSCLYTYTLYLYTHLYTHTHKLGKDLNISSFSFEEINNAAAKKGGKAFFLPFFKLNIGFLCALFFLVFLLAVPFRIYHNESSASI